MKSYRLLFELYAELGISEDATLEEIKAALHRFAHLIHPSYPIHPVHHGAFDTKAKVGRIGDLLLEFRHQE